MFDTINYLLKSVLNPFVIHDEYNDVFKWSFLKRCSPVNLPDSRRYITAYEILILCIETTQTMLYLLIHNVLLYFTDNGRKAKRFYVPNIRPTKTIFEKIQNRRLRSAEQATLCQQSLSVSTEKCSRNVSVVYR